MKTKLLTMIGGMLFLLVVTYVLETYVFKDTGTNHQPSVPTVPSSTNGNEYQL